MREEEEEKAQQCRLSRFCPWRFQDPRQTSTQSLHPADKLKYELSRVSLPNDEERPSIPSPAIPHESSLGSRRRLLVIYVHGYNGDTTSFRSFPAHVHGYLGHRLANTHVIHTKIYPRYKTYRALQVATEEFGEWLTPHVDNQTDIILVGHSMGGLITADVVLLVRSASLCITSYQVGNELISFTVAYQRSFKLSSFPTPNSWDSFMRFAIFRYKCSNCSCGYQKSLFQKTRQRQWYPCNRNSSIVSIYTHFLSLMSKP